MLNWVQNMPLSAGGYNTVPKIRMEISSKDGITLTKSSRLKLRSVDCLSISLPLKQQKKLTIKSKVSVRSHSQ